MALNAAHRAAAEAARHSYGRLLALLSARSRDIAAAEDALADALASALRSWPVSGVPDNPDAWLLTAARNQLSNEARHRAVIEAAAADLVEWPGSTEGRHYGFPDERLKLLFVCAHPAIDPGLHTPLMLQAVLGLDAAQTGRAFLIPATTIGQRLVRAKAKIRDARLRFDIPEASEMPSRLNAVLEAVYAAYGQGWDAIPGAELRHQELSGESIYLARLLVQLLPAEPEPKGLLALILYCEARRAARRSSDGRFIPLADQDSRLWSRDLIIEAENLLTSASRAGQFGRFQCEAAIQSIHVQRPLTGRVPHEALITLYGLLADRCPTIGSVVSLAAALVSAGRAQDADACLQAMDAVQVDTYQPYWVVRAQMLRAQCDLQAAASALQRAIDLTEDGSVRDYLSSHLR